MSRARVLCLSIVGALASVVLVAGPAQATTYTLSGVVRDAAGAPVAGIGVDWRTGFSTSPTEWKTATTTAADGSYQLAVPSDADEVSLFILGDYLGDQLYARTQTFQMTGDRVENATLPVGATARVTVVDGDGAPVVDATVTSTERFALTPTSGGLDLISRFGSDTCDTPASGVCEFTAFRGGSIESFGVQPPGSTEVAHFDGLDTPDAVNEKELVVGLDHVGGTLRANDGSAIQGATVKLVRNGVTSTTTSDAAGEYAFSVLPSDGAVLTAAGKVTEGSRSGPFTLTTSPFDITGARNEMVTLPPLATLAIDVQDSLGTPVPGASVTFSGDASTRAASTSSGIDYSVALFPLNRELCEQTSASGVCNMTVFLAGSSPQFAVNRPDNVGQSFPGVVTNSDPTHVTARLVGYASAGSAGTRPGRFVLTTPVSSHADVMSLSASPVDLPDGLEPLVGRMDYAVSLPAGGTTTLTFNLPAQAVANDVVRVGADGEVVSVGAGQHSSTVTRTVTDGSATDVDGVVNGVVTGSVLPVLRAPLAITTSELPGAVPGHPYAVTLVGSGPVPPYTWTVRSGSLPSGLTLSEDGMISGTPTTLGTSTFEVEMRESTGSSFVARRTLTLTVATVAVATTSLPDAYVGGGYRVELERIGGAFSSWRRLDGYLPPGLQMSRTGVIAGRPTAVGTYQFHVAVSSAGKSGPPQLLTIVVRPMEVATASLPNGSVGRWYSQTLTTLGGRTTLSWSLVDGSLPTNLRLTSAGRITGTPRTPGTWTFMVRVADSSVPKQVATRTLSLTVH